MVVARVDRNAGWSEPRVGRDRIRGGVDGAGAVRRRDRGAAGQRVRRVDRGCRRTVIAGRGAARTLDELQSRLDRELGAKLQVNASDESAFAFLGNDPAAGEIPTEAS